MKHNKVKANYNMNFDNGHFIKEKIYQYRYDKEKVFITTEEGKEQELWYAEFNKLFTILKN